MADNPHVTKMTDIRATDTTSPGGRTTASEGGSDMIVCGMGGKGLKGLFLTVACCAVPLILLLALPVLGTGLGGRIAPVVNTLAVLACPVGMALMMWMMRQGRQAGTWRQLGKTVAAIFVVAVLTNYPWELAQGPLYVGMTSFRAMWWHCFVASLGDGLLILGIFAIGWLILRQHTWFVHPGVQGYGVMLTTGLVIGLTIEWVAVHLLGRWMYTAQMPLVPGLAIGVVPVVQMLVLPLLIFRLVAVWCGRTSGSK